MARARMARLDKKQFEYKLRMDAEKHEKLLMDEAGGLQLIEDADIERVEVTLNRALIAVEKIKNEEGERRSSVQKELSVLVDEFAIKDSGCNRGRTDVTLSRAEAVSITTRKKTSARRKTDE